MNRIHEIEKKITTPAGFEPARAEPNRFQVCRLNHSAIVPRYFGKRKKVVRPDTARKFTRNRLQTALTGTRHPNIQPHTLHKVFPTHSYPFPPQNSHFCSCSLNAHLQHPNTLPCPGPQRPTPQHHTVTNSIPHRNQTGPSRRLQQPHAQETVRGTYGQSAVESRCGERHTLAQKQPHGRACIHRQRPERLQLCC